MNLTYIISLENRSMLFLPLIRQITANNQMLNQSNAQSINHSRPVYRMCAQVVPSGECLRGKGHQMLAKTWRRLFLAAYNLWAKPGCCCCPA